MQGPSEMGVVGDATLKNWDRKADLAKITVPVLTVGATYDTMDPKQMEWMSTQVQMELIIIVPMEVIGVCMMIKRFISGCYRFYKIPLIRFFLLHKMISKFK